MRIDLRPTLTLGIALGLVTALSAPEAAAYCRARACDFDSPASVPCRRDADECPTNGALLYWPESSIDFWVDHKGSAKSAVSGEQAASVLRSALGAWTAVACKDGAPSISVDNVRIQTDDAAVRAALEQPANAEADDPAITTSMLTFLDIGGDQLMSSDAVALTTTSYGRRSGRILGADIEVDSTDFHFTLPEQTPGTNDYDLLAVLTHEAGHVYGLADLRQPGATMFGSYFGVDQRALQADDKSGMCAMYPSDRFDDNGGCSYVPSKLDASAPLAFALGFLTLVGLRRSRRRAA